MTDTFKLLSLATAIVVSLGSAPGHAVPDQSVPDSFAIVDVQTPAQGQLMHLVGMVGHGTVRLHLPGGKTCKSMKIRFVAGGFWGRDDISRDPTIRLVIHDPRALGRLKRGRPVVSDEIGGGINDRAFTDGRAGYTIVRGIPDNTGFVITPRTFRGGLFGPRQRSIGCRSLRQDFATLRR